MAASASDAHAVEERVVAIALVGTWPIYAIGGLYVLGPVLGVLLTALVFARTYLRAGTPSAPRPIPFGVWVWIVTMFVMLLALFMGHWTQGLSTGQTIKSAIGWAKGWALFAMFPLAGACLSACPR